MKKILKIFVLALLCVCLAQGAVTLAGEPLKVQAASKTVKKGLKKEGKYYYYYQNGKKVKNTWKTVTTKTSSGKKVSYKYYFGSNGRAYMAPSRKSYGYTKNVIRKKIGKYYYGFDTKGHMVKSGYYNDPDKFDKNGDSLTWYFDKNGRYNAAKSKAIQKAGAYKANASKIRKILGTPKKTLTLNSCSGEEGEDYQLVYSTITVTLHRYPNGKETVYGIFPA